MTHFKVDLKFRSMVHKIQQELLYATKICLTGTWTDRQTDKSTKGRVCCLKANLKIGNLKVKLILKFYGRSTNVQTYSLYMYVCNLCMYVMYVCMYVCMYDVCVCMYVLSVNCELDNVSYLRADLVEKAHSCCDNAKTVWQQNVDL